MRRNCVFTLEKICRSENDRKLKLGNKFFVFFVLEKINDIRVNANTFFSNLLHDQKALFIIKSLSCKNCHDFYFVWFVRLLIYVSVCM